MSYYETKELRLIIEIEKTKNSKKPIRLTFVKDSEYLFGAKLTDINTQEVWNLLIYWLKDFLNNL